MAQNTGTFLVSGIQDVSALLPIIGTEQCERHVGEALRGGFLYAAAAPISLFGCLGIVKASGSILCASVSSRLAQMLANAGFSLEGSTATMIGRTPESVAQVAQDMQAVQKFIAGQRFLDVLQEQHIDKSRVHLKFTSYRWNCWLCLATLCLSCLAITPYIAILAEAHPPSSPIPAWGYPVMRILGSALSVVVAQMVIQIRMQEIITPLQSVCCILH
jgi:hypothetical protein